MRVPVSMRRPCRPAEAALPLGAAGAFGGERNHRRNHPGHRLDRVLDLLADRFPGFDFRGIDAQREEHLAVRHHDVGQNTAVGEFRSTRRSDGRKPLADLIVWWAPRGAVS